MRRKVTPKKASPRGAKGNANINIKARGKTPLKAIKQTGRPSQTPTGKGLGKAGAKRLGRLLKRAIIVPEEQQESTGREKLSLPKTPFRLFKHQIQSEAENANTAKPDVPQLILSVVSHCKHRGGISMAELKQALAAGGYNITKNNRRVNVVTQRLVDDETLVRTRRNVSFRLNNKDDTKQVQTRSMKSPKRREDLKQREKVSKSSKEAEKSQGQTRRTPKPKGKTHTPAVKSNKLARKTRKQPTKSHKPKGKTRKPAGKSHKLAAKTRKPRRKTPKAKRKSPKPAGKKSRSTTNQVARVRKTPRKAPRAQKRRPMQNRHPYKSSRKRPAPRRRPRVKTQQHRVARRRAYYY
ncbi:histone H1-like [Centropristis striata]|uniref:histone H1-like n=1 Tax=Centropristis striata TaxID=184440 RepID=UPI0027E13F18|nr:histone H1-like [Centropristis striata]